MQALYRSQSEDTSVETDRFFFERLRQVSAIDRWKMADAMMRDARQMSLWSLKRRFGKLGPIALAQKVAQAWLQEDYPKHYIPLGTEMTWIQDSSTLAAELHQIFRALQIPYYITGGVAAIVYGEPRTTRDLDVVLAIQREDLDRLVAALEEKKFYVPGVEDAKSGRMKTLGITHIETIARADLVIAGHEEFDRIQFDRRESIEMPGTGEFYIASPEDLILNKLRWGKQSQSEKQWRDVLGILKVQGDTLDFDYLKEWSLQLGLREDLDRVAAESGWAIE
jgi:hypothetical protein